MRGVVLACGENAPSVPTHTGFEAVSVPSRPGKADIDALLAEAERLVVAGTDADLAAVTLRLLRKDRLRETSVAYIPTDTNSVVAALWGLPTDSAGALNLAIRGDVDTVPLIRDDSGGVLVGKGTVGPVRGVAYCDDDSALRGPAKLIEVTPDPDGGPGLVVEVTRGMVFKRRSAFAGRAFELGCIPSTPISDGVAFPRPMKRWVWYRHTDDLRLVRGLA